MGDFKDMWRALKETRRLEEQRTSWRGFLVEVVSWLLVFAALVAILKWLL